MHTCEIQWIDANGNATPDNNPAIGRVRIRDHVVQFADRGVRVPAGKWLYICAEHAKRMNNSECMNWEWDESRPLDIPLPDGWDWDKVEAMRAEWNIPDHMVPLVLVHGVIAWGTINSVRQEQAQRAAAEEREANDPWRKTALRCGWEPFRDKFNVLCWRDPSDGMTWAGTAENLCRDCLGLTEPDEA